MSNFLILVPLSISETLLFALMSKECKINKTTFYTHCFSLREKGVRGKKSIGARVFLKEKSKIFLSKTSVAPQSPSLARLFRVAKNSA